MSAHIQDFVNEVLGKTEIALALSIIASTPPGKTAEDYTKELQEKIVEQWFSDEGSRENKTLSRLLVERIHLTRKQHSAASQLSSLISWTKGSTKSTSQDSGYSSCEKYEVGGTGTQQPCLGISMGVQEVLGNNLDFDRGVVRLMTLIGNTDSQVADAEGNPNYTTASFVVQHTLQTATAEATVRKSIQGIHRHLCAIALHTSQLTTTLFHWEGSFVQHSVSVLRKLSSEGYFHKAIANSTKLVATVLITDMLKNYGLEKNIKLENEATLLFQVCVTSGNSAPILNMLIEQISIFTANKVTFQSDSTNSPTHKTIFFESCYFILDLTNKLLNRYFVDRRALSTNETPSKQDKGETINELWREFWEQNKRSRTPQSKCKEPGDGCLVQSWLKSLQNTANVFSVDYPLISFFANSCAQIIVVNQS